MAKVTNNFVPKNTAIEALNPMTKILAIFSLGLGSLIFPNSWLGIVIIIGLFSWQQWQKCWFPLQNDFWVWNSHYSDADVHSGLLQSQNETVIFDLGFAKFCEEGALYALKIITTLLVFLGTFYIMNKTTYTGKLVAALTASGLNPKAGYLVLASLNVVPQMQRRMSVIQEAQSARGVETGGSLSGRIKAFIPLLGPVVMSSLTDAQERGMTLETRGFGIKNVKQTTYVEVTKSQADKILKVLLITFFVVVLILTILMKLNII